MTATKLTPWQGITPGDRCNRYAAFHPVDRRNTLCPDREFVTDDTAGFRRRPSMAPVAQLNDRVDALSEAMETQKEPRHRTRTTSTQPGMDTRFTVGCHRDDHRRRRACSWGEQ